MFQGPDNYAWRVPFASERLTCRSSSNVPPSVGAGLDWCCFFDFVDGVSSSVGDVEDARFRLFGSLIFMWSVREASL